MYYNYRKYDFRRIRLKGKTRIEKHKGFVIWINLFQIYT